MFRTTRVLIFVIALLAAGCTPSAGAVPDATQPAPTQLAVSPIPVTTAPTAMPIPVGISLTDGLARKVSLASPAQRIVSLAPSITENLFAIGAGQQVVGRDDYSDYPPAALQVTSIGSTYENLNTEAILSLKPDLVLAAGFNTPDQIKALEDLGLTVYYFENPVDFAGMYQQLKILGELTGKSIEVEQIVKTLQERVSAVIEKAATASSKPSVYYEIDGTDISKPWTIGTGTFMDALIGMAGGTNIGSVIAQPFGQISLEEIVKQDSSFIILGDTLMGVTVESIGKRSGWEQLSAVKAGRVIAFDDSQASRPGPRLVDGLEALFKILHPELSAAN